MHNQKNKTDKKPAKNLLHCCLFFTANSLARTITRMAENHFGKIGLSPSHGFLLTLTVESPGITQKQLAQYLNLSQSTVSRFVDTLVLRKLVEKKSEGKNSFVFPTSEGKKLQRKVSSLWKDFYQQYCDILGKENADGLSKKIDQAHAKLEDSC